MTSILEQWRDCEVGMGYHFKALERRTGLTRDAVRAAVREQAHLGNLVHQKGLFTEDGEPYGCAYVLTPAGRTALAQEYRS